MMKMGLFNFHCTFLYKGHSAGASFGVLYIVGILP